MLSADPRSHQQGYTMSTASARLVLAASELSLTRVCDTCSRVVARPPPPPPPPSVPMHAQSASSMRRQHPSQSSMSCRPHPLRRSSACSPMPPSSVARSTCGTMRRSLSLSSTLHRRSASCALPHTSLASLLPASPPVCRRTQCQTIYQYMRPSPCVRVCMQPIREAGKLSKIKTAAMKASLLLQLRAGGHSLGDFHSAEYTLDQSGRYVTAHVP